MQDQSGGRGGTSRAAGVLAGFAAIVVLLACVPTVAGPQTREEHSHGGLNITLDPEQPFGSINERDADSSAGTTELRRLETAIGGLDCSRLRLVDSLATGGVELRGHVPSAELVPDLLASSRRLLGGGTRVTGNVMVLPPPYCTVLEAIESLGLTQSRFQRNDPLAVGAEAWSDIVRVTEGDRAVFNLRAPGYDAHITIDYFDRDGRVMHLMPTDIAADNRYRANVPLSIGGAADPRRMYFSAPLGLDIALVIATSEPLHDSRGPAVEDAAGYLDWLDGRVQAQREAHPDFHGEWAFMLILTEPG